MFYIQNIKAKILKDEDLKTQEALGEGDIPIIATIAVILGLIGKRLLTVILPGKYVFRKSKAKQTIKA